MKYLIIFPLFLLLSLKTSAQTTSGNPDTTVYGSAETNFPGGWNAYNTFIQKKAHYPAVARENRIQGCAYIKLSIETDGTLSDLSVYSGIGSGMDNEAVRVMKESGKWIPSQINGNNVRTNCIVPVRFILDVYGDGKASAIDGHVSDTTYLANIIAFDSYGVSLENISKYAGKSVKFVGRVYGTKMISDTVFALSCVESDYPKKYTNIIMMGKDAQSDDLKKAHAGELIQGTGVVVDSNGIFVIVIEDRKQYKLMPGFRRKI